jgi:hypothetical protein
VRVSVRVKMLSVTRGRDEQTISVELPDTMSPSAIVQVVRQEAEIMAMGMLGLLPVDEADAIDEKAERQFTRPINPDPVTIMARNR